MRVVIGRKHMVYCASKFIQNERYKEKKQTLIIALKTTFSSETAYCYLQLFLLRQQISFSVSLLA